MKINKLERIELGNNQVAIRVTYTKNGFFESGTFTKDAIKEYDSSTSFWVWLESGKNVGGMDYSKMKSLETFYLSGAKEYIVNE